MINYILIIGDRMKKGFTLIEMLGIITVLAILLLVTFPNLSKSLKQTKETKNNNFTNNLKISAEAYIELNRDNYENLDIPGTEISFSVQDLYDANLLKGQYENVNSQDKIKVIVGTDGILRYFFNGSQIGIETQESDDNLSREIALIKENLNQSIPDGIYYYNSEGNLEDNTNFIYLTRNWNKPNGNILVHNHQFISGCIQMNDKNYDYYKGELTELNYPCSTIRGENLVVNGDLSFGDNTNFSYFIYQQDGEGNGYLTKTVKNIGTQTTDFFIPVDPNKNYEIGFTAKNNNTSSLYYAGIIEYDIDNRFNGNNSYIGPTSIQFLPNTLTTLARDLNNGDEYVYLTDLTHWVKNASQTYYRGFIFWNYKDSTGYEYPELTYSNNRWTNLYENEDIDLENNRIKLNSKWDKGYITAGTKLSQSRSGATYNFTLLSNQPLTENYQTYSTTITGLNNTGTRKEKKFDPGTRYIKFYIWQNSWQNYTGENITIDFKDIYIREITQ